MHISEEIVKIIGNFCKIFNDLVNLTKLYQSPFWLIFKIFLYHYCAHRLLFTSREWECNSGGSNSCHQLTVLRHGIYVHKDKVTLHWRHNGRNCVSNHQPYNCLLNRLFGRRSKKTSKLRVTGLCEGNSPGTGEFPAQMASNAENVSIWWRHHDLKQHSVITLATYKYGIQLLDMKDGVWIDKVYLKRWLATR